MKILRERLEPYVKLIMEQKGVSELEALWECATYLILALDEAQKGE